MKIIVAVRCYNESKNIERFMRGYDFADEIVVSDGGSTDGSVELLKAYPKVRLLHFAEHEHIKGYTWNPDAPHINYVLNWAKSLKPDWLVYDDMDCVPNQSLRENARTILEQCEKLQVNAFRLYMWGDDKYFPFMNRNFDPAYKSLWAWKPDNVDIHADETVRHGTMVGISPDYCGLDEPNVLLHKSYDPNTIDAKLKRYNALGLPMVHPLESNGALAELPEYAHE